MKDGSFLTIREFARKVNYSERSIRQMCIDGKIKAQKLGDKGRKWLIPRSEVNKFEDEASPKAPKKESHLERVAGIDPLVIDAKKKHIADMAAIVDALLANGLDIVRKHPSTEGNEKFEYSTVIGDSVEALSHEQLGDRLRVNLGLKWVRMNAEDINDFLAHLKADYHELESKDIPTIITENPYELIEALRVLIRRRTLKGTCSVCKDWQ